MTTQALETRLSGVLLLQPAVHADDRGFFLETYRANDYRVLGVDAPFVQDNHSRSTRGTVRALHFQLTPGQAKLVRVSRGSIFDVVVDLRRSSATFGQWESFTLDDVRHQQVYVPIGFAHGFCALSDLADVVYKVSSTYDAATERGVAWDDRDIGIEWPIADPFLSERDRNNPSLRSISRELPDW